MIMCDLITIYELILLPWYLLPFNMHSKIQKIFLDWNMEA